MKETGIQTSNILNSIFFYVRFLDEPLEERKGDRWSLSPMDICSSRESANGLPS